jgi:hypothetical protein
LVRFCSHASPPPPRSYGAPQSNVTALGMAGAVTWFPTAVWAGYFQ